MKCYTVAYKAVADLDILADVDRPETDRAAPVILFIHGGALVEGSRTWINEIQRSEFLEDGFAVVSIDYRLAPETKLAEIASDIDDAISWVRNEGAKQYHLDPNRLAIIGQSAGGYLALLAGCRVQPRPRAVVSFYGYGDITASWLSRPAAFYTQMPPVEAEKAFRVVGTSPVSCIESPASYERDRLYVYCRQHGVWPQVVVGHDPKLEPEAFLHYCPVNHVDRDYPPTLLLHGDADTDVPYEQSVLMAARLDRAGVDHELITIANGDHGFDNDVSQPGVALALKRVRQFLKQHVSVR
jgi:acetyl esterase/lipase